MKIKITKCSMPNYWYNNHIGDIFEVEFKVHHYYNGMCYKVINNDIHNNRGIGIDDCLIINETESNMKTIGIGSIITIDDYERKIINQKYIKCNINKNIKIYQLNNLLWYTEEYIQNHIQKKVELYKYRYKINKIWKETTCYYANDDQFCNSIIEVDDFEKIPESMIEKEL